MESVVTTSPTTPSPTPSRREARHLLVPACDIFESDTEILLVAELPGVLADGVKLGVENGQLLLDATPPSESPYGDARFQRSFLVPRTVRSEDIQAELKDGLLRVRLPKSDAARKRVVEVKVA